jgi:tetratricopeptide (TPR) repeat protein
MRHLHRLVCCLAVATTSVGCAHPQSPPPRPAAGTPSPAPLLSHALRKKIAREWFVVAQHAIAEERYADGIQAYETAYRHLPHPNVAFNLGRAHAAYGNYAASIGWLEVYLASDPADREEVQSLLNWVRERRKRKLRPALRE